MLIQTKRQELKLLSQTVDKVGVGDYSQHQLFVNSHCFNKN